MRQGGVGHEMRSAVHVDTVVGRLEEGVGHSWSGRRSATGGGDGDRSLGFVAVGPARPFELEAAIVGDVDLLVGMIDQEGIGARDEKRPKLEDVPNW